MNIAKYMSLFCNRTDVFAEQQPNGMYFPVHQQLTPEDIEEHLAGIASYGCYVIQPGENTVSYVCWDLDIVDEEAATTLCRLVQSMVDKVNTDSTCLMREFSGNKGTHVWLFFDGPVPAEKVRRWVAADFMPQWQAAARQNGWPTALEVFPKQDSVQVGGFGNLVKLPLGVHRVSGARSEIVCVQGWANSVEEVHALPSALVPDREVAVQSGPRRVGVGGEPVQGPHSPFACIDTIMRDGVGSGYRDRAMFMLALYLYGSGLDQDLAQEACERANEHFDPPLTDNEVRTKVESAYTGRYQGASCGQDWLADVCPGPCGRGGPGRSREPTALASVREGESITMTAINVRTEDGTKRVSLLHPEAANQPTLVIPR